MVRGLTRFATLNKVSLAQVIGAQRGPAEAGGWVVPGAGRGRGMQTGAKKGTTTRYCSSICAPAQTAMEHLSDLCAKVTPTSEERAWRDPGSDLLPGTSP